MNKQLERLILLQDLYALKRDLANQETLEQFEDMGFRIERLERIEQALQELIDEINPEVYARFQRLAQKYSRPLAAIHKGICYGCFMALPTSYGAKIQKNEEMAYCDHCGRIIYVVD